MTTIKGSCPTCGTVNLHENAIELAVYDVIRPGAIGKNQIGTYSFECPECVELITKPVDLRIAGLLISGGVDIDVIPEPISEEVILDFQRDADAIIDQILGGT